MTRTTTRQTPAVEASGLRKRFGATRALDGLDLTIPRGDIYAVLGPNGAGKTTLIRVLTTLLRPDAGSATVLGHDVATEGPAVRRRISLTSQFASIDEDLTAEENLVLLAHLCGWSWRDSRRRAHGLLAAFELEDAARRSVATFSGGMRRRLDIAASLVHTPELLFLDEPTTGLDPRSRGAVWDLVRESVDRGTTVVLTTQYLEEADRLAARIAVVDQGRVIAQGTRAELKASAGAGRFQVRLAVESQRTEADVLLRSHLGLAPSPTGDPALLSVQIPQAHGDAAGVAMRALTLLADAGVGVSDFAYGQPSLDEVFLALTGHGVAGESDDDDQEGAA